MSDYDFDLGSFDDLAAVDLGNMDFGNLDLGGLDLGGLDLGSMDFGSDFDLGSFDDLAAVDGLDLSGLDLGSLDLGNLDLGSLADLGSFDDLAAVDNLDLGGTDFGSNFDLGSFDDLAAVDQNVFDLDQAAPPANIAELMSSMDSTSAENLANTDWDALYDEGLTPEQVAARREMAAYTGDRVQDFGDSVDMNASMDSFSTNLQDIVDNRGGFTSQWQKVGGNMVMVNDDPQNGSTATVYNPTTGQTSYLNATQTAALTANGTINTKGSGYVEATGGTGFVPGGGQTFYNNDGTKTVVTTDGKVLTVGKDGEVTDTKRRVDVNDERAVTSTCPSPEMLILLSSGQHKKAGDLQVGDEVETQHEKTMEWGNFKVTHAEIIPNAKRLNIKLDGKDFICSVDHKFYKNGAWVDAKDVVVGDVLSDKTVTEILEHSTGDVVQITVDDAHTYICEGVLSHNKSRVPTTTGTATTTGTTTKTGTDTKTGTGGGAGTTKKDGMSSLLPLLLALLAMNKGGGGGGGGGGGAVIPGLTATQRQTPYAQQQRAPGYRPGQGGITYFDQTQYAPKMAAGGIARLLQGPGDGVSDSIPAVITDGMAGGGQPAKVARGEYIIDARTVAALGNGSTDAGAERLDKMRQNILRDDRKAGVGKDSKAYRHLAT